MAIYGIEGEISEEDFSTCVGEEHLIITFGASDESNTASRIVVETSISEITLSSTWGDDCCHSCIIGAIRGRICLTLTNYGTIIHCNHFLGEVGVVELHTSMEILGDSEVADQQISGLFGQDSVFHILVDGKVVEH